MPTDVISHWASIQMPPESADMRPGPPTRSRSKGASSGSRSRWAGFEGGSVYAFRDLTAERAVERLKSDFVSTISHELRTPLWPRSTARLSRYTSRTSSWASLCEQGLLEVIASESDRLARIVNNILWASRLESGGMQTLGGTL